ncbi:amino acid adenylation domain-containing protein [Nonomuraea sp. NPDC050786]|uniref:non-ribosomal peptide synthetase n=1 Tax=Nonomuraea sp. NPDC050786 TaxID=3154840 RepID=UPI0033E5215F
MSVPGDESPPRDGSPLDAGTEALWLLHQLVPDRALSNVAMAIEFDRPPRWWPLREALNWLVRRHVSLRTSFPAVDGLPTRAPAAADVPVELDIHASTPEAVEADLRAYAGVPFDLEEPPLLRAGLFAVDTCRHIVCLVADHIVIDAASLRMLVEELGQAYQALAADGAPPALPPPAELPPPAMSPEALRFWRDHIAGHDPAGMRLEGASEPVGSPTFAGHQVERPMSDEAVRALATLRRRCRATDAIVLLSAYYVTLHGHGAANDALVGVMMDTRPGGAAAVGYHVATLPFRMALAPDMSFETLVARVTRLMVDAIEHGPVPFEVLARDHTGTESTGLAWWRNRLVRCLFNFRPEVPNPVPAGGGSRIRDVSAGLSRFDLELTVAPIGAQTVAYLLLSTEAYDPGLARAFLERLDVVLTQAAADPARQLADFDLRTGTDRRVVAEANRTGVTWPRPETVPGMVAAIAKRQPTATAIVEGDSRVTYEQVTHAAAAIAGQLGGLGVGPGAVVAIAAPRGAAVAAAALGVWAAGAAYLPMDPDHPPSRLAEQLTDAGCRVVIGALPQSCVAGRAVLPVPELGSFAPPGLPPASSATDPDSPAYLIYTSGSTGRPKGVVLTHRNLANVVRHFATHLDLGGDTGMLWLTTFAFDISALEVFLPLAVGGRVIVAADELRADPEALLDIIDAAEVSVVQATPTTWRLAAPVAKGRLANRVVLCGGEPLPSPLAAQLLATDARVLNVYGPTETAIWSSAAEVCSTGPIIVGRPISNTRVAVLDPRGRPRPIGLSGELYIGGAGVAVGYHNRKELTAERFVDVAGIGRCYRTGDLARWHPDGTLELLGREDRQIKLRAHRIELGEVESVLEDHPEVRAAAVQLSGDPTADGRLVAFVAATERPGLTADIWDAAARRLPGYSLPGHIVVLTELPSTHNGKIDYQALLGYVAPIDEQPLRADADRESSDPTVAMLVDLWRSALARPGVGAQDNLFLSGGDSLTALKLAAAAADRVGVPVTMAMVFRAPTPQALARLIQNEGAGR